MEKQIGVYAIRNIVTGKVYIGSSVSLDDRKKTHIYKLRCNKHHCSYLQNSWNKHGEKAFVFESIKLVSDIHSLRDAEQEQINYYKDKKLLYNTSFDVQAPMRGRTLSEEAKRKIGEANKKRPHPIGEKNPFYGKHHSDETKRILREQRVCKSPTEETRHKISLANKGRSISSEHRQRLSVALTGRIRSEQHRKHLSEANRGKRHSEETKLKLSHSLAGRKFTEEHKKKISEALKGHPGCWLGKKMPEYIVKKIAVANTGRTCSEETKRKISIANTGHTAWNKGRTGIY